MTEFFIICDSYACPTDGNILTVRVPEEGEDLLLFGPVLNVRVSEQRQERTFWPAPDNGVRTYALILDHPVSISCPISKSPKIALVGEEIVGESRGKSGSEESERRGKSHRVDSIECTVSAASYTLTTFGELVRDHTHQYSRCSTIESHVTRSWPPFLHRPRRNIKRRRRRLIIAALCLPHPLPTRRRWVAPPGP